MGPTDASRATDGLEAQWTCWRSEIREAPRKKKVGYGWSPSAALGNFGSATFVGSTDVPTGAPGEGLTSSTTVYGTHSPDAPQVSGGGGSGGGFINTAQP